MTRIGQMFEQETVERVNKKVVEMAKRMLDEDIDLVKIMNVTGFTEAQLESIREQMRYNR